MALSLLFGRASMDHELALLEEMQLVRKHDPQAQIFYVVPNHIKFESEINILSRLADLDGRRGAALVTPNVQVFSLSRLAWYYMQDDPIYRQSNLSENGLVMLVQRLLAENVDQLEQYQGMLGKQGFISQFSKQLLELKQSGLTWNGVRQMAQDLSDQVVLQRKLNDFALIGEALDQEMAERGQYLSSELLTALKLFLATSRIDIKNHYFFINGYSQMTPSERGVVEALIEHAGGVTIALTTDDGAASITTDKLIDYDLFYKPKALAQNFRDFAQSKNIAVIANGIDRKRDISTTYIEVENFWIDYVQHGIGQSKSGTLVPDLEIVELSSRYHEVDQMARTIRREVAQGKARYRDYILLTPDLGQYENIIPAIFAKYDIPIFMDLDRPMAAHPLVAFIRKLLVLAPNYSLVDIMTLLKTELLIPAGIDRETYRDALALTENYALAKNFTGWRWTDQTNWQYDYRVTDEDDGTVRERAAKQDGQLALIHDQISKLIAPLLDKLERTADARAIVSILYRFMKSTGVDQQIIQWRDLAIENGDLWGAQQPEQVWRTLMDIFDDFVNVFDSERISLADLSDLLGAAFDNAKYTGIPATMDQVRISESGIVQNKGYQTVMVFGATSTNLPATVNQKSLLHDLDRAKLSPVLPENVYLNDTAEQTMSEEELRIYNAMMIGTHRLIWLYATSNGEKQQQASSFVLRLKKQFDLDVEVQPRLPFFAGGSDDVDPWVGSTPVTTANILIAKRLAQQADTPLSESWKALQRLVEKENLALTQQLFGALFYQNRPQDVHPALIQNLFGTNLKTSISRLESYARNPYEFFLKYGLRLQERQVLALTPAEKGTLMHGLLEHSFQGLIKNHQTLGELSATQLIEQTNQALQSLMELDDPTYDIFKSTPRMEFLTKLLREQVEQALFNMQRGQAQGGTIHSLAVETGFGLGKGGLDPIKHELPAGEVTVRGKIDRYDQVGEDYLAVVDYKSSAKVFDYNQALAGLELQLLTYWDAMTKNAHTIADKQIAAAVFWTLNSNLIKAEDLSVDSFKALQEQALSESHEQGKYRGIILDTGNFVDELAGNDEDKAPFAIKRKKSGDFAASADVISEEEQSILLDFVAAKTTQLAGQILEGKFPLQPYRDGNKTALQYSEYKSIMRFDAMMGDQYHDLMGKLKKEDALTAMQALINKVRGADA